MKINSRNLKNSGWSMVNILLYPVAFMGLTPLFINGMGESRFGIWMLLNSYVYIAVHIISFGFSNSITAHVAEALGRDDRVKLFAYLNSSARIISILALATSLLALLAFLAFHSFHSFPAFAAFPAFDPNAVILATLLIAVKFHELLFQSVFKGFERFDLAGQYNILNKFLVLGAQLALVLAGYGLAALFLWSLVINFTVVVIQGLAMHRLVRGFRFRWKRHPAESRDLFEFGFWTWVQTVISVAAYQADRFIVAFVLGPAVAGYYILASTIANHMHMAFGAMASWLFPKVAREKQTPGGETLAWFHTLRGFTTGVSLAAILVAYLAYRPFFSIWLGPDNFPKIDSFFALFLAYEAMLILSIIPQFYLNGMRMLKFITGLELMYKTGILAGMFIAFTISPTGESLLLGQIAALVLFMPVEFFLVNRKVLRDNPLSETITTMIPSLCVVGLILAGMPLVTAGLAITGAVVFRLYYLRPSRFKFKMLTA